MHAALIAFAVSALATPLARAAAVRTGIVNAPNPLVVSHTRPVAYLGGVAILIAVAAASLLIDPFPRHVVVVAALCGGLGLIDDLRPFRAPTKLLAQIVTAAAAVAITGGSWWEAVAIVVFVNCFNLTDVCDGLVTGLSMIAFAAWAATTPAIAPVALSFSAACLAFLLFNAPDASIYLGDCGSHVLGGAFAAMACEALRGPRPAAAAASALLLAAIPILETLFIITERRRHGRRWWKGSRDHYSLRLQAAGWSKQRVLAASYAAALLFAVAAAIVGRGTFYVTATAVAVVAAFAGVAWWRLSALSP